MSALVLADEIARFNEGERVHARLYAFLSLFLWPLSAAAAWLIALLLLALVGLDDQLWLRRVVLVGLLAGLALSARAQWRRLLAADAALEAFYGGAAVGGTAGAAAPVVAADGEPAETPPLLRLRSTLGYVLLAAPRCAAKAKFSFRRAISWDDAQIAAGQALFEALGATGGAWVACSAHAGSGALMAGLERLELVEHRADQGGEIRLHPDIRRRYFPKDPGQPMFAEPPRRR